MTINVDAEYLEELEEKAKRHDFFEGYIKGIEVAFAFAEELMKNIGNRKDAPQTHEIRTDTHECVKDTHDKTEPTSSKMEQVDEPQYEMGMGTLKCDNCSKYGSFKCTKCDGEMYFKRLEPKTEPQTNADQHIQSVESVRNNDEIIVRSNLEPFRVDEPKDEPQTCSFSDCDNFKNPDYERCIECKRKQIKLKTEQTERSE